MEDKDSARLELSGPAAFASLVEATQLSLVRLAARLMGNLSEGEDVVQEAYMKAFRALEQGHFEGRAHAQTWLRRIVTNTALDALRARRRRPRPSAELEDEDPTQEGQAQARLALAELDHWLHTLPPDQRVTLILKHVEGLRATEIAELMQCSEGAVEQRLVRARAALKAFRGEQDD